ncbi:TonB-dependent receptor [Xanthomonas sp. XNM01]|uniref:TonB-dependent receptor n=1 Tax=Xanthomonas sp. XNM01 TaxID=2769289 RepID=UPI001786A2FA|nr:TonB-dependent receptor [Xanthomonas sp. XNM01]MBD9368925.1 TonB-dependent receptor [Xanthomonas sp. XNM01]
MNPNHQAPHRKLLTVALASCLALGVTPAFAQSTSATIRGQVMADSAPASDATITVTNTATGLSRTARSSAGGGYSVGGLPPGRYRIQVESGGQTNVQELTVQVGQTATLNLGVGGVAETASAGDATTLDAVEVTATAAVETKTSEVATYVTQRQIEALPQASRNFLAFADTVPGMVFETRSNNTTQLKSGAQSANGVNVFIDGVGQKSYTLAGGISGQTQSQGNPFPQLAIGEYKVITSNYKAEYDQISSAAVTAVTKSGTNEFSGDFFWDKTGTPDWRESTPIEEAQGFKNPSGETQYGAALGGPIIKDKLFFFVTYEAKEFDRPRTVRADNQLNAGDLTPELAQYLNTVTVPFNQDLWFGKLTWQAGENHLIELSTKQREESEITDIGNGPNSESFGKTNNNESSRYDLRWQFSSADWLNDMHLTYEDDTFNPRAINLVNGQQIVGWSQGPTATRRGVFLNLGGGADYQDKGQKGWGFQNDLTFTGWDRHTIKVGVKYKDVELNAFEQQPYNPQFRYDYYANLLAGNSALASMIPYEVQFAPDYSGSRNISSDNKQFGIYIQDDWDVTDKLQLNIGLRWDYETSSSWEDFVTPQGVVDALRGWANVNNPGVDYDYNDYISTGSNRKPFKDAWQPRLGFSYDLFGDQRHVIFGGAGRAYDRNVFDYLALERSKGAFPSFTYQFNSPNHACTVGTGNCIAWDPAYYDRQNLYALISGPSRSGAEVDLINNELKVPYSDQLSLGMRNIVTVGGHDWNTSAAVAYIESHDGILFTLGNRNPDGSYHAPGATFGSAPWGQPLPGYGSLILADNAVETRITQLLLSVDKPFTEESPWGFTMAYTYSDAKENRGNAANSDEHYSFDYPNLDNVQFVRSVGISKHRFVATGIAEYWGLQFSAKLTVASPPGKDALNCYFVDGCANGYFETLYFSPSRQRQLDLAVQKEWDTGTDLKLRIRGDVFNVTNDRSYVNFNTNRGDVQNGTLVPNPAFGERSNQEILANLPRTFKLSFGLHW